jgi:lipoprotein NlpI
MKFAVLFLAVAIFAAAAPAGAKTRADLKAGNEARHGGAFEKAVGLYTLAIKSGHLEGPALAGAYVKRGDTYRDQARYDRAIADFATALNIDPGQAEALNGRALVFSQQGRYDQAITDYRAALKLKPDFAFAYTALGRAYFFKGDFALAAVSFKDRLKIKPRHVFPMLWLFLARARSGGDAKPELAGYLADAKKGFWIYQAALLYMGKASPQQVLDAAGKGEPEERRQRGAEANFYIGQYFLINGNNEAAARYFKKVVDTGITRFYEYTGAEVELRRMARAR